MQNKMYVFLQPAYLSDSLVESERGVDHIHGQFLDGRREVGIGQMLTQNTVVDGHYRLVVGEADREHTEVSLKHTRSRVRTPPTTKFLKFNLMPLCSWNTQTRRLV